MLEVEDTRETMDKKSANRPSTGTAKADGKKSGKLTSLTLGVLFRLTWSPWWHAATESEVWPARVMSGAFAIT